MTEDNFEFEFLDLAETHPGIPLSALANKTEGALTGIELRDALVEAARRSGREGWLARDLLVREWQRWLPSGWSETSDDADFKLAATLGTWRTLVASLVSKGPEVSRQIWDQRSRLSGWVPFGPDDSDLVGLMEHTDATEPRPSEP